MDGQEATNGARRFRLASPVTAIVLAVLALLLPAAALPLYALTRQNLVENGFQVIVIFMSFVTVALVIAWHRPGNPIGWIILAGGLPGAGH